MRLISAIAILFIVMDPLGNIPIFLAVLKQFEPKKSRKIIVRESVIALLILVFFLFAGGYILDILCISQESLSIAGGVILLIIALRMIFTGAETIFKMDEYGEPFIVPLAIPCLAGPSTMTTLILITAKEPQSSPKWLLALFVAWLLCAVILFFSSFLSKVLGKRGLSACERLMGMLLTAVAVEMLVHGITEHILLLQ